MKRKDLQNCPLENITDRIISWHESTEHETLFSRDRLSADRDYSNHYVCVRPCVCVCVCPSVRHAPPPPHTHKSL